MYFLFWHFYGCVDDQVTEWHEYATEEEARAGAAKVEADFGAAHVSWVIVKGEKLGQSR